MRLPSPAKAVLIAFALSALVWACDDHPTSPDQTNNTTNPPAPTVFRLNLSGPGTVALNESSQFTVIADMTDGSQKDVTTNQASWQSSNPSVLSISQFTGLATGLGAGEVSVRAGLNGRFAEKADVVVVRAGTYRVTGSITDEGLPLAGVRVAAWPSQLEATTDSFGQYKLYGLSGDTEIQATKTGYVDQKKRLVIGAHQSVSFSMVLNGSRDSVAGTSMVNAWRFATRFPSVTVMRMSGYVPASFPRGT